MPLNVRHRLLSPLGSLPQLLLILFDLLLQRRAFDRNDSRPGNFRNKRLFNFNFKIAPAGTQFIFAQRDVGENIFQFLVLQIVDK